MGLAGGGRLDRAHCVFARVSGRSFSTGCDRGFGYWNGVPGGVAVGGASCARLVGHSFLGWRLALAVAAPLALLAVQPGEDTAAAMGAVMGLGVGYVLEGRTLGLSVAGPWRQRVLRARWG